MHADFILCLHVGFGNDHWNLLLLREPKQPRISGFSDSIKQHVFLKFGFIWASIAIEQLFLCWWTYFFINFEDISQDYSTCYVSCTQDMTGSSTTIGYLQIVTHEDM